MSRLIDADSLKRELDVMIEDYKDYEDVLKSGDRKKDIQKYLDFTKFLRNLVEVQATAYDVDKVTHELRKKAFRSGISTVIEFEDVMNIIQKGGIE